MGIRINPLKLSEFKLRFPKIYLNIILLNVCYMADAGDVGLLAGIVIGFGVIATLTAWATGIGAGNDYGGSIGCGCGCSLIFGLISALGGIMDI